MTDIWFISDTHFWHANMLKFTKPDGSLARPGFEGVESMNEVLITNWNSVVKPQDHVWHLGDVTFRYDGAFNNIMSRLNGHKRLCVGNHDKLLNPNLLRWFDKVVLWRPWKEENLTLSHIPLRPDSMKFTYNIHGHTHYRNVDDPRYINVCVEQTAYTPIHLDEIRAMIKDRT